MNKTEIAAIQAVADTSYLSDILKVYCEIYGIKKVLYALSDSVESIGQKSATDARAELFNNLAYKLLDLQKEVPNE